MYQQAEFEPSSQKYTGHRRKSKEDRSWLARIVKRSLSSDRKTAYYVYRSSCPKPGVPLMVSVHGIRRQAKLQARLFAPLIESIGGTLVVPVFQRKKYTDYQRLGRHGYGQRSDLALKSVLAEVGNETDASSPSIVMFGYSGGGQFVHRFAMSYPRQVLRIAIAASGWYTFPDRRLPYPEGIGYCKDLPDVFLDPARFLQIPTLVLVGEHDSIRDRTLNQSKNLDIRQGKDRIERARNWATAMRTAAAQYNYETDIKFSVVPGCGHSFEECMTKGDMGQNVINFLFNGLSRHENKFS